MENENIAISLARSQIKKTRTVREDTTNRRDLHKICKLLTEFAIEAKKESGFIFSCRVGKYDVYIEPKVGITLTPYLLRRKYLVNEKIHFRFYRWDGKNQEGTKGTLAQVAEILTEQNLWDDFFRQAICFLEGQEILMEMKPLEQPLLN